MINNKTQLLARDLEVEAGSGERVALRFHFDYSHRTSKLNCGPTIKKIYDK